MDWKVLVGTNIFLLILLSTAIKSDDDEKKVVCYYTNWSVYRPGTAKFSPQNINPYLCTHLIYAFGGFTKDNTLKPFDKYQDIDKGGYAKFTGLKTYNKNLKTLLAIGGWNEGSSRFSPMVADPQRRRKLVKNAVKFLRQNHFDGLDLDWEYPAFREGGKPRDKDNYASLVQELREEFEKEASKTGKPRLLLTMAVPAGIEYIDKGYDIPKLNEYLDFINLLSYDYHSAYEPAVNHHSPLYPLEEDNEYNYDNELTIDYTIKHLLKSGASSEKIVIGIPTYGRSYTLFNEDATALGSPADGPGEEGDATREKGYLAYYEICENIMKNDWTVEKPNPKAMGPFAYKGNQWVGYDDEDIVRAKSKYVNENKLGGIMFWSIDNDDFRGKCHGRQYPLIEAAKEALYEENGKEKEDERPNAINSRKSNRISENSKSNPQVNNEKSNKASSRRNGGSRSSNKRSSSTASPLKPRSRSNSRSSNEQKLDDESEDENIKNKSTRSQSANKNRFRTRSNINDRDNHKKQTSVSTTTRKTQKSKITTPEPPTTPDPGSDFKCEDEGFFPHPRDCKKYFWCLDSGPSGLGIVANQFTCPSGLVFNKLADSCDYPRNVVCPKVKVKTVEESTTVQTTTTKKEDDIEDDEEVEEEYEEDDLKEIEDKKIEEKPKKVISTTTTTTTARSLLYKTINRNRLTSAATTSTTTIAPSTTDSEQPSDDSIDEEQDPKVIKELIDLIKKAGGIEQLEKQLALQEKNIAGNSNQESGQITPATISKSLYDRVLSRQNVKSNLFGIPPTRLSSNRKTDEIEDEEDEEDKEEINNRPKSKTKFVNGPGKSQFEGLDEVPEVKSLRRHNKPKYVTIERHSSSTTSTKDDDLINEDDEDDDKREDDNEDEASSEEKLISNIPEEKILSTPRSTPGYFNIRRSKPSTTTESLRIESDIKETSIKEEPKHQNIRRTSFRHTDQAQKVVTEETETPKTRYVSANRFRSTTTAPVQSTEQTNDQSFSSLSTPQIFDGSYVTIKSSTTPQPLKEEQVTFKLETTKVSNTEDSTVGKYDTSAQFNDESHITTKLTTPRSYDQEQITTKSATTLQFFEEGQITVKSPTTTQTYNDDYVTEGKTITVAGESGRISINPLTTESPSTARIFSDDLSSTLKSSNPITEEKFINTRYITKQFPESTVSPNPNTIEDSVTDSVSRIKPTESTARETIAVVSQPRPFGFPRRTRPTTVTSNVFESTRSSLAGIEPTPKPKVNNYPRNPGLNLFRRPGDPQLPRGVYTVVSSATLSPATKIYPVQLDIENTRVVGLVADQNGNPQNLELILADPPALISSTTDSGRATFTRPGFRRKVSTTISAQTTTEIPASRNPSRVISSEKRRQGQKYDSNRIVSNNSYQIRSRPYKPAVTDYDYYDDEEERFVGKPNDKIFITSRGFIKCLDQGNFAHPNSCKKFISCAKMVNGKVIGTEYTCPAKLSFDPIGGICNWSAGLGCSE